MIPLINLLIEKGVEVILASDGRALRLLEEEYPQLEIIELVSYDVRYSESESMFVSMSKQTPKFLNNIRKEHKQIEQIVIQKNISAVISDNRYGAWSNRVPSIFITHQVFIAIPDHLKFLNPVVHKLNHYFIKKYDQCWIPDFAGPDNLSGDLSHKKPLPEKKFKFIGPLSRLQPNLSSTDEQNKVLILLSGPEPHRTRLEEILTAEALKIDNDVVMICGKTNQSKSSKQINNIKKVSFATTSEIQQYFDEATLIVCRAGYSSIMDLAATGKKAILIPTEGQTEQEYLAKYLKKNNIYYSNDQNCINLKTEIQKTKLYTGLRLKLENKTLEKIVYEFLRNY